jgi:DNA-binding transcriptional MerR regulator
MSRQVVMRIGQVARDADVNVQTLRFYERQGLLPAARRQLSGYRQYTPDTVRLVRFIKRAQELGFSLRDVKELIELRRSSPRSCAAVREAAARKAADVAGKIRHLTAMQAALQRLTDACGDAAGVRCPIIDALNDEAIDGGDRAARLEILSRGA